MRRLKNKKQTVIRQERLCLIAEMMKHRITSRAEIRRRLAKMGYEIGLTAITKDVAYILEMWRRETEDSLKSLGEKGLAKYTKQLEADAEAALGDYEESKREEVTVEQTCSQCRGEGYVLKNGVWDGTCKLCKGEGVVKHWRKVTRNTGDIKSLRHATAATVEAARLQGLPQREPERKIIEGTVVHAHLMENNPFKDATDEEVLVALKRIEQLRLAGQSDVIDVEVVDKEEETSE